eukprot:7517247-Pyramimonas_sp.AAC.2
MSLRETNPYTSQHMGRCAYLSYVASNVNDLNLENAHRILFSGRVNRGRRFNETQTACCSGATVACDPSNCYCRSDLGQSRTA